MVIGDDISVGAQYDARAESAGLLFTFPLLLTLTRLLLILRAEEEVEERVIEATEALLSTSCGVTFD